MSKIVIGNNMFYPPSNFFEGLKLQRSSFLFCRILVGKYFFRRMTAASDSAVAPMEEALRFLSNSPTTAATTVESIPHVPGAIILRQLLTREECNNLAKEVRNVHLQWEEESKRRRNLSSSSSSSSSSTTTTTSTTTSSTTSDTSTSTTATTTTTNPVSRRRSQHHLPRRVSSSSLATLSARIRPYVAQVAGPKAPANSATLLPPGEELSTFLRCYHYKKGDTSTPHYDKSFTTSTEKIEKIEKGKKKRIGGGRLDDTALQLKHHFNYFQLVFEFLNFCCFVTFPVSYV